MSNRTYDILVVGELNVDIILNKINKLPQLGQEQRAGEMTVTMGSSTAIFASNISRLGASVSFLGKIGNDFYGTFMRDALAACNVGTDAVIVDPKQKTGATISFVIEQDRMMVTYPGAMEHLTVADVSDDDLKTARHLHTSSIFFQPGIKKGLVDLLHRAKKYGLTTSMDTQWDPDEKWDLDLENLLPHLDFFLPNETELIHLARVDDVEEALQKLSHHTTCLVIKRGAKGVIMQYQNKRNSVVPLRVPEVIDTIGAGDSFNAGFINAFLHGKNLETCLVEGNRTAAVSITAAGGTNAIFSYRQVQEKAKKMENIN